MGHPSTRKNERPPLPQRIWIVGPPGSGKSTLASHAAGALDTRAIHMDELYWRPGWQNASDAELMDRVGRIVSSDRWVIDGNYRRIQQHFRHRADLFVWLDLPRHVCMRRILFRCLQRVRTREACCNGNYESVRMTFASRDSLLLYTWRMHSNYQKRYSQELADYDHVRLKSERDVECWLRRFRREARGEDPL